jgi:two-component system alkaline phosphatase synthesis response regulator PhoP
LSKRALIVDDEEIVIQLISRYLAAAELNLDVKSTQSGLESLIIAGQYKPDLVILDVNLADVGGKKVLELLKQRAPSESCKILMISGNVESLSDFVERGADDCLSKPFSATDLVRKVVNLLKIERRRQ